MAKGVLVDFNKCIGCRACQVACKQWNELEAEETTNRGTIENPPNLSAQTFTKLLFREVEHEGKFHWIFAKTQCMHCKEAACKTACLVGAFAKTDYGAIVYDEGKCIGCRYCQMACPFGVPTYMWDNRWPWIRKCTFCADLQSNGHQPACVSTCPTEALLFGEREDLIKEARERIGTHPGHYVDHIYGEKEVGGTSWLYISPVPFEQIGFYKMRSEAATFNVSRAMSAVPPGLLGVAALMTSLYFLNKRRRKLAQEKAGKEEGK